MIRILLIALLASAFTLPAGCYKIDIQQGNYLDQDDLEQLRPGMSKRQVQALLGTPLLSDPFNAQRWDYVYNFFPSSDEHQGERRHISLYFQGEILDRIDGDLSPPASQQN